MKPVFNTDEWELQAETAEAAGSCYPDWKLAGAVSGGSLLALAAARCGNEGRRKVGLAGAASGGSLLALAAARCGDEGEFERAIL